MAMTDEMVQLLEKCHHVMSEDYNSSVNIPSDILREAGQRDQFDKQWADYLRYKFRYMLLLETDRGRGADAKIGAELRSNRVHHLRRFLPQWKARARKERMVYFYRCCQLPRETVETLWYDPQTQACNQWCEKCYGELEGLGAKPKDSTWVQWVSRIYAEIGTKPVATCRQDQILSAAFTTAVKGLIDRVNSVRQCMNAPEDSSAFGAQASRKYRQVMAEVVKCFECFSGTRLQNVVADASLLDGDLLSRLSFELMTVLHSSWFDETAVLNQFLQLLKAHFQCEVCDFLEVTDDGGKIVWRAATVNKEDLSARYQDLSDDELRQRILARESYGRGEGISGTVLLLDNKADRNLWNHVGSNDVQRDPRQSRKHRSAYERDMYPGALKANGGQIRNFWIFPVFHKNRLIGAFRVVNKLTSDGQPQPGGWPYLTKVQLALVGQWFSRFLEIVQEQLQVREDSIAIMQWNEKLSEMMAKLRLRWVERRALQAILGHLERDINKKEEKLPVGCCIIIAKVDGRSRALPGLDDYPLLDCRRGSIERPYSGLNAYHKAVNPLLGAYVFDQRGTFLRTVKLGAGDDRTGNGASGYEAIRKATSTHKDAVCFLLPTGARSVLIYQHGSMVAELLLSEKTGDRRIRYPDEILQKMVAGAPSVSRRILRLIRDACLELSFRGCGGLLVVGDVQFDDFNLTEPTVPCTSECRLESMGKDVLVEFAKMDGATFVDRKGCVTRVNRIVKPIKDPGGAPLFPDRAARHDAGEKISKRARGALVVVVSENRGISIVAGGKSVAADL